MSVVIPVFNEAQTLPRLYQRLQQALSQVSVPYEILFVNDGSTDATLQILKAWGAENPRVKYIDFSRNFGHQVAIAAGLHFCKGERVVVMDADLQDPPELIRDMYAKMQEGWDVVYGKRNERSGDGWWKRWSAKMFYRLLSRLASVRIPEEAGDFRMMSRKVVNALNHMPEHHKFVRGMVSWVGFRQTFIAYDHDARVAGRSGYSLGAMFRFALDGITAFSNLPLKLATWMGFLFSGVSFVLILWAIYAKFVSQTYVQGWASIIISILFIGGIQLICLGLIGEYLIRMDANVRQRPLYIINEMNCEPPIAVKSNFSTSGNVPTDTIL